MQQAKNDLWSEQPKAFASFDGTCLYGTLCVPMGPVRAVMVLVHGITSQRSELGIFDRLAHAVAELGVASVRFDWRGHGESHLPSHEISLGGILSDIDAAWKTLTSELHLPVSTPLFVVGSSFGGGVAYHWAAQKDVAQRAFLLAPVLDYHADLDACAPRWRSELMKEDGLASYGPLKLSRALFNEALYFSSLAAGQPLPATIFHGTADSNVPFHHSVRAAQDTPHISLVGIEGAEHLICIPGDFQMKTEPSQKILTTVLSTITAEVEAFL